MPELRETIRQSVRESVREAVEEAREEMDAGVDPDRMDALEVRVDEVEDKMEDIRKVLGAIERQLDNSESVEDLEDVLGDEMETLKALRKSIGEI